MFDVIPVSCQNEELKNEDKGHMEIENLVVLEFNGPINTF